jgi:uncharacterized protein (TIGR01777 family)
MRFVLAGASGFLGRALRADLEHDGHEIAQLVRRPARTPAEVHWDPDRGEIDPAVLAGADAVVNLAGASIGRVPWTPAYRRTLRQSRIGTTRTLARALARQPNGAVLVVQSGTAYYGKDCGTRELTEDAPAGDGFLATLAHDWEQASGPAELAGTRVVRLRTGVVCDAAGGAFPLMAMPFRLGLGGRLGSGRQYMPMVTLTDWLAALRFTVAQPACSGSYNVTLAQPTTNAEFTRAVAVGMHRPSLVPVPALAVKAVLGEFSWELIGSRRVRPHRLLEAGFTFTAPDVDSLVQASLHRS